MTTQASPKARGSLDSTSLPSLVVGLYRQRSDGRLTIRQGSVERAFLFRQGSPVGVDSNLPSDSIIERSKLSDRDRRRVRAQTRKPDSHEGIAILKLGLMDPASLFRIIKKQTAEALRDSFGWQNGCFEFQKEASTRAELAPFRIDPLPLVHEGLVAYWDVERLFAALQHDLTRFVSLRPGLAEILKRLRTEQDFNPKRWSPERTLGANLLHTRLSPLNLSTLWVLKECDAIRLTETPFGIGEPLRALSGTKVVIEVEAEIGPEPVRPSLPKVPCKASKDDSELRAELERICKEGEDLDHYSLFEIEHDAKPATIKKAFLRLSKRYHPDKLVGQNAIHLQPLASEVFARLSDAFEVLSDAKRRRDYDARLRGEPGNIDGDRISRAEIGYRKAELLLQMGNFGEAAEYLRQSIALWPEDAAFHSALGWSLFKMTPSDPSAARQSLERAVALAAEDAVAHFRLGLVSRALGDRDTSARALARARELEHSRS